MKIYQVDVKVAATAYIIAKDEAEALKLFEQNFAEWNDDILFEGGIVNGDNFLTMICDALVNGPFVSISPAITYHGHWGDPATAPELELVYQEKESDDD